MEEYPTPERLYAETADFMRLHWPKAETAPTWSDPWQYEGTIPFNTQPGCYAVLSRGEVIYVGVGAGKGVARYAGAGLGDRLRGYYRERRDEAGARVGRGLYQPHPNWPEAEALVTLGLPHERYYLAYALEPFLIGRLNPRRNSKGLRAPGDTPAF